MDNNINVDQIVQAVKKREQIKYIVISLLGIIVFFSLWIFYFNNLDSQNWRSFFTIMLVGIMSIFFAYGIVKFIDVNNLTNKYRIVLTKYASLIERVQIPQDSLITECLVGGTGRFGFDKVFYHIWKDESELVFYPVRPVYSNAKDYELVQAVRLNEDMIRSYYVTGLQFSEVPQVITRKEIANNGRTSPATDNSELEYQDTRATIIAYAVGDQTVYLTFSLNLNDYLKEILPEKDRVKI